MVGVVVVRGVEVWGGDWGEREEGCVGKYNCIGCIIMSVVSSWGMRVGVRVGKEEVGRSVR